MNRVYALIMGLDPGPDTYDLLREIDGVGSGVRVTGTVSASVGELERWQQASAERRAAHEDRCRVYREQQLEDQRAVEEVAGEARGRRVRWSWWEREAKDRWDEWLVEREKEPELRKPRKRKHTCKWCRCKPAPPFPSPAPVPVRKVSKRKGPVTCGMCSTKGHSRTSCVFRVKVYGPDGEMVLAKTVDEARAMCRERGFHAIRILEYPKGGYPFVVEHEC